MKPTELVPILKALIEAVERGEAPDRDIEYGDYWEVVDPFELVLEPPVMVGNIPGDVEFARSIGQPGVPLNSVQLRALASLLRAASIPDF